MRCNVKNCQTRKYYTICTDYKSKRFDVIVRKNLSDQPCSFVSRLCFDTKRFNQVCKSRKKKKMICTLHSKLSINRESAHDQHLAAVVGAQLRDQRVSNCRFSRNANLQQLRPTRIAWALTREKTTTAAGSVSVC